MSLDIDNETKRLKNLRNYKDKSEDELREIAKINLIVKEFKNSPIFLYDGEDKGIKKRLEDEKNIAIEKFKNYLTEYKIESASDIDTLKSLVFTEILELRVQRELNEASIKGQFPSPKTTENLLDLQNQKLSLKVKLGIDKTEVKDTELTQLEKLEKRFERYIEENRNEFTLDVPLICEKCNHEAKYSFLLRRRVKDFDAIKHPWFIGRWFFNLPIIKFVKEGVLTKDQAAEILSNASENIETQSAFSKQYCSDMIDYMIDHWAEIVNYRK